MGLWGRRGMGRRDGANSMIDEYMKGRMNEIIWLKGLVAVGVE